AGYVEFDTVRHLIVTGTFRHLVSARMVVNEFEKKMTLAVTMDDHWKAICEAGRELGCANIRMSLRGSAFEECDRDRERQPCCTIRIPLSPDEYVNFKYPVASSVRNAVAISSIVEILRRSLAREQREAAAARVVGRPAVRTAEVVGL